MLIFSKNKLHSKAKEISPNKLNLLLIKKNNFGENVENNITRLKK